MATDAALASIRVRVTSPEGLHARPAALFVRAVLDSGLGVTITKISDDENAPPSALAPTDARSILGVLALDVSQGDEVELSATGSRAGAVVAALAALLAT
jgi:phosphocarrier protein